MCGRGVIPAADFLTGDYLKCKWERNDVLRLIKKVIVELNDNKEALEKEKHALETRGVEMSMSPRLLPCFNYGSL